MIQVLGYIGYGVLVCLTITFSIAIRSRPLSTYTPMTIASSLFFVIMSACFSLSKVDKIHTWWIIVVGLLFFQKVLPHIVVRSPVVCNITKKVARTFASIVKIGVQDNREITSNLSVAHQNPKKQYENQDISRDHSQAEHGEMENANARDVINAHIAVYTIDIAAKTLVTLLSINKTAAKVFSFKAKKVDSTVFDDLSAKQFREYFANLFLNNHFKEMWQHMSLFFLDMAILEYRRRCFTTQDIDSLIKSIVYGTDMSEQFFTHNYDLFYSHERHSHDEILKSLFNQLIHLTYSDQKSIEKNVDVFSDDLEVLLLRFYGHYLEFIMKYLDRALLGEGTQVVKKRII